MSCKAFPVAAHQLPPTLNVKPGLLAVESRLHRRGVHQSVRLSKVRQATDADPAVPTQKSPDLDAQHGRQHRGHVTPVIAEGLQTVGVLAVGAVLWCANLLVKVLLNVLFSRNGNRADELHRPELSTDPALDKRA